MAAATIFRSIAYARVLRPDHHRIPYVSVVSRLLLRPFCELVRSEEDSSPCLTPFSGSIPLTADEPWRRNKILGDTDDADWKTKEEEILNDVGPSISRVKEILHSGRYADGEKLSAEDEETVFEKILLHHPNALDKIGCGFDAIMVDRHPQFRWSRCLFVVRTDGVWIDFSYQKCVRCYIQAKYPAHAERFIRKHLKRGSGQP